MTTVGLKGERLKSARERAGVTQAELAVYLNVAQPNIVRWEKGKVNPTTETLTRIALFLNVSLDYLVGLADEPVGQASDIELSPMERRLLQAVREGLITEALKTFTALTERED